MPIYVEMVQTKRDAIALKKKLIKEGWEHLEVSKDIDGNMWHVSGDKEEYKERA